MLRSLKDLARYKVNATDGETIVLSVPVDDLREVLPSARVEAEGGQ
jgi:hypothetical protein